MTRRNPRPVRPMPVGRLTHLVSKWRREVNTAQHNLGAAIACSSRATLIERIRTFRRCADQLELVLLSKP